MMLLFQPLILVVFLAFSHGLAQRVTQTVGLEGATIVGPDGFTVVIPANVLVENPPLTITIEKIHPKTLSRPIKLRPEETAISDYYSVTTSEFIAARTTELFEFYVPMPQGQVYVPLFGNRHGGIIAGIQFYGYNRNNNYKKEFYWERGLYSRLPASLFSGHVTWLVRFGPEPITFVLIRLN